MNTNQFWNPAEPKHYWNAINLTKSISKTPSFESLSDEEKIQRRLDRMENTVNECNNVINTHNNNVQKYYNRINEIIDKSDEYMKDFYEESSNFATNNVIDSLIWLTYSDEEKKKILDEEIESYNVRLVINN